MNLRPEETALLRAAVADLAIVVAPIFADALAASQHQASRKALWATVYAQALTLNNYDAPQCADNALDQFDLRFPS